MQPLSLPLIDAHITQHNGKQYIFDPWRKKNVRLTPEEWVRQHFIHYLITSLQYPASLIKIEATKTLPNSSHKRRADILISDNQQGHPLMLVECKAAHQPIQPPALTQITQYNIIFHAPLLTITNGIQHLCYAINPSKKNYTVLPNIPSFPHTQTLTTCATET